MASFCLGEKNRLFDVWQNTIFLSVSPKKHFLSVLTHHHCLLQGSPATRAQPYSRGGTTTCSYSRGGTTTCSSRTCASRTCAASASENCKILRMDRTAFVKICLNIDSERNFQRNGLSASVAGIWNQGNRNICKWSQDYGIRMSCVSLMFRSQAHPNEPGPEVWPWVCGKVRFVCRGHVTHLCVHSLYTSHNFNCFAPCLVIFQFACIDTFSDYFVYMGKLREELSTLMGPNG